MSDADREVASVMAWVLPGGGRTPAVPDDVTLFVQRVDYQRVSGLVSAAIADHDTVDWPDDVCADVQARLDDVHLGALRSSLAAEAASVAVSELFASAGIRHAVLKGCATAHLDYPDPAMRTTGDVDVLISRDDHARAIGLLEETGHQRIMPAFRMRWERHYGKDIPMVGPDGIEIDLHLALVAGYFGVAMPTEQLLGQSVTYEVAGHQLPALDVTGRLVHAAIHTAATTPIRLGSAADIVNIAASGEVAAIDVAATAIALECDGIVARGVERTWDAFDLDDTELSSWAKSHRCDERQAAALEGLVGGGELKWQSGLAALPPWKRPGYLLPLLVPSRGHLRHRGRSHVDHLRISTRRLRGRPERNK